MGWGEVDHEFRKGADVAAARRRAPSSHCRRTVLRPEVDAGLEDEYARSQGVEEAVEQRREERRAPQPSIRNRASDYREQRGGRGGGRPPAEVFVGKIVSKQEQKDGQGLGRIEREDRRSRAPSLREVVLIAVPVEHVVDRDRCP